MAFLRLNVVGLAFLVFAAGCDAAEEPVLDGQVDDDGGGTPDDGGADDGGGSFDGGSRDGGGSRDAGGAADAGRAVDGGPHTGTDAWVPPPEHAVTYHADDRSSGGVPADTSTYVEGATVVVAGPADLARDGHTFSTWTTSPAGAGTPYAPGSTFTMPAADVDLYASWAPIPYSVTYDANGATGGTAPTDPITYHVGDTVTVLDNTGSLARGGYAFTGWNTQADGSGTHLDPGATFAIGLASVTLYASWEPIAYTVTYDANSATGGTAPTDATTYYAGDTVTVRGNTGSLARTGYTFTGWNTQADGLGMHFAPASTFEIGTASVTLFAEWEGNLQTITFDSVGGTGTMAPITARTGSTVTLPASAFSRVHWAFAGWGTSLTSWVVHANRASFTMPPNALALYAKWTIPTVSVPGGTFRRDATATNTSTVSAFHMARYEVTVDQILELGFTDTTGATNLEVPFDDASWFFALAFCNRLSIREGRTPVYSIGGSTNPSSWGSIPTGSSTTWDRVVADWSADGWRMPTEMEWIWAAMGARDGTTGYTKTFPGSTGSNSIGDYAWLAANAGGVRHVVGTRMPNELGIYDLAGNAQEQIWDREDNYTYVTGPVTDYRGPGGTSPATRVYRGGSYTSGPEWGRLSSLGRSWGPEYYAYHGIRLVRRP